MKKRIIHDRSTETIEEKTRWFRSLSMVERAEILNEFTELALAANPKILVKKDATEYCVNIRTRILALPGCSIQIDPQIHARSSKPVKGRIRVLSKA